MKKIIFASLLMLDIFSNKIQAQYPNIQIGGMYNEWPNEPSVCINPLNTNEIIIGANADNYYISDDGGLTWQQGTLSSSYGVNCDPVIISDFSGNFYYFHLVPDLSRVVCQKKTGLQPGWSNGTFTADYGNSDIDKEWAAFDPVTGNLYVCWTRFSSWGSPNPNDSTDIFVARSTDGGTTWSDQKLISNTGGNASAGFYSVHGSYITTGPNGEVYVVWWSPAGLMFDRSTNEGETWLGTDINISGFPVQWITSIPGIQTGVSFPVINCDRSTGPYRGTLYVNWADKRNGGGNSDIWLAKSTDNGTNWSAPVRVNDDTYPRHQFFNYMTIDQITGNIYIIFYDRRNYTDTNTDVYVAVSEDGGDSFSNYRISETPFIPFSTVFFGHYIGISAYNNKVFTSWMRMDNGVLSLWGAPFDPEPAGMEIQPAIPFSITQNSPNPFQEHTFFSFKLEKPGVITLTISDITGKQLATLIDHEKYGSGKHVVHFFPEKYQLASGVYYYSLISEQQRITKKMIYNFWTN